MVRMFVSAPRKVEFNDGPGAVAGGAAALITWLLPGCLPEGRGRRVERVEQTHGAAIACPLTLGPVGSSSTVPDTVLHTTHKHAGTCT